MGLAFKLLRSVQERLYRAAASARSMSGAFVVPLFPVESSSSSSISAATSSDTKGAGLESTPNQLGPRAAVLPESHVPNAIRFTRSGATGHYAPYSTTRLGAADQWGRLASVINTAIEGAAAADQKQAAALRQVDLAQYGMTKLMDELEGVMALPGRPSRTAKLHEISAASEVSDTTQSAIAA